MPRLLVVVCAFTLAGCGSQDEVLAPSLNAQSAHPSVRERLGKLKYQRDKLKLSVSRLETERESILRRIREQGITSTDDLRSHPNWTIDARELKQVVESVKQLEKTVAFHDAAIVRIESILRYADREKRLEYSTLTETELNELALTFYEVDEQLKSQSDLPSIEELELESLLEQELAN